MKEVDDTPKGALVCPVCQKSQIVAYSDAKGHASMRCDVCRRLLMVDYDAMTVMTTKPIKSGTLHRKSRSSN